MSQVKYPELRADVLWVLGALADPSFQERVWIGKAGTENERYNGFSMAVHTLCDHAFLADDPVGAVGEILRNEAEASAIAEVIRALELTFDDIGTEAPDASYVAHPRWSAVVSAASAALELLESP